MLNRDARTLPAAVAVLAVTLAVGVTGCTDEILDVNDPDVVTPRQLEGPAGVPNRVAGMINDFREAYDDYVNYTGLLTDEFVLGGTFPTRLEIDQRRPGPDNTTIEGDVWTPMQVSLRTATDNDSLFTANLDNEAFSNVKSDLREGIALARLFGGYQRVFFSELFCQSSGDKNVAAAARVGQARALMFLGNYQEAASRVAQVPTDFVFTMEYSANTPSETNEVYARSWGTNNFNLRWTIGNGKDQSRGNEKYAFYDSWVSKGLIIPPEAHDRTAFGSPNRPVSLENIYTSKSDPIPLATGWEARMIEAEAMLRNGQAGAAQQMVNKLLSSPELNPIADVTFEPVDFTDGGGFQPQDDLPEMARARAAGLWLQGQRQGTLRRFFRN
ncbi:MAG: hypothetical protein ABEJ46_04740, partial [Gemmatimonadota bacterium]